MVLDIADSCLNVVGCSVELDTVDAVALSVALGKNYVAGCFEELGTVDEVAPSAALGKNCAVGCFEELDTVDAVAPSAALGKNYAVGCFEEPDIVGNCYAVEIVVAPDFADCNCYAVAQQEQLNLSEVDC